jgi:hypothetical protein
MNIADSSSNPDAIAVITPSPLKVHAIRPLRTKNRAESAVAITLSGARPGTMLTTDDVDGDWLIKTNVVRLR